jgi:CBS-domain-containing membrane protein
LIGEQNIFYADNRIFQSTELAIARAMSIVDMQRSRAEATTAAAQEHTLVATTAADLMQKRCLRFGSRHQTREAMWLISQFQSRMKTDHPQTVFLQDLEGKLCAELSVRTILKDLSSAIPNRDISNIDDAELARLLQTRLFGDISSLATEAPVTLSHTAPLAEVFSRAARHGFRPMPVSDAHGRLAGVFDEMAMLRGLTKLLVTEQSKKEGPPEPPVTEPLPTVPLT